MLTILLVGELGSRLDNLGDLLAQAGHVVERIPSRIACCSLIRSLMCYSRIWC